MSPIEETLRTFIVDNYLYGDGDSLKEDTSFEEKGIIDSTGILDLILFLEETYGIKVEDNEVVKGNFDTLEKIAQYLKKKLSLAA